MFSFQFMLRSAVYQKISARQRFIYFLGFLAIYLGSVVVPLPKIALNLHRTYEKLHCKERPNRFSGKRNPLVQTDHIWIGQNIFFFITINMLLSIFSLGIAKKIAYSKVFWKTPSLWELCWIVQTLNSVPTL